jgi:hypothetical protein
MSDSDDRRLTTRVLKVWKKIAGANFPRRSQIDPSELSTDWSHCMMIDLDQTLQRSRFSHVGNALRDSSWPTFDRQCIAECLEGTLLELVAKHLPEVLEKEKPVAFAGSATHEGDDILYRTILLPLSENGKEIDGVLAAIGYREVVVAQEIPLSDGMTAPAPELTAAIAARAAKPKRETRANGAAG